MGELLTQLRKENMQAMKDKDTLKKGVLSLLISAIAPVGANVAVYAQLHSKDYVYASKTVVISTLLSLVSMPAVVLLAQYLLG